MEGERSVPVLYYPPAIHHAAQRTAVLLPEEVSGIEGPHPGVGVVGGLRQGRGTSSQKGGEGDETHPKPDMRTENLGITLKLVLE